jgi:uracil phosphoribosyltransferase
MPVHIATHPLIAHKLTRLRDRKTGTHDFRRILREITFYLGYDATRDLKVTPEIVQTPMNANFEGSKIAENIAIIPILRAGLGMSDAMLELLPKAAVHHIGRGIMNFIIY